MLGDAGAAGNGGLDPPDGGWAWAGPRLLGLQACCLQEHLGISKDEKSWSCADSGMDEQPPFFTSNLRPEPKTDVPNVAFAAGQEVTATAGYYIITWLIAGGSGSAFLIWA